MLQTLLEELLEIPGVTVLTTRDFRLPSLGLGVEAVTITADTDVWQCWAECIEAADAVWPIAPETGGVLEKLSALVIAQGKQLLGSRPEAVAVTARKSETSMLLEQHAIDVVPTFRPKEIPVNCHGPWVAKPDDGAGCDDTSCFNDGHELQIWLGHGGRTNSHVVQPYLSGTAASLSMVCKDGASWLLSCNRQSIQLQGGRFSYGGSVLNAMAQHWQGFAEVAQAVAQAVPGLAGYVGVDVMVAGDRITVLEINPRLTTSYAGMRQAIGCNPARLILDLFYNGNFEISQPLARNVVEISL